MLAIRFDEDKWRSQFRPGEPSLVKVVLAGEPAGVQAAAAAGHRRFGRQLVLDPAYQLK